MNPATCCIANNCSSYSSQPALSVPIHVVELTNVPPELRINTGALTKPSELAKPSPAEAKGPKVSPYPCRTNAPLEQRQGGQGQ